MRKFFAIVLVCTPVVLASAEAAADFFTDLDRAAPRGTPGPSSDAITRDPFDRINDAAPVRQPAPRDDIYIGE